MDKLMLAIRIEVNDKIYMKNPESSDLGKKIIEESIFMIDEMGFESFTFKKLGERIKSNESSVYRYFENKHKLLLYLASWFWGWLERNVVFATYGMSDCTEKLKKAIAILTQKVEEDNSFAHINEVLLHKIVINEYSKSYLTKEVDKENKEGYFIIYKRLVDRLHNMIVAVNKDYPYPSSLASTILEGALHQHFLKEHFPVLTNCNTTTTPTHYFTDLVFRALNNTAHG